MVRLLRNNQALQHLEGSMGGRLGDILMNTNGPVNEEILKNLDHETEQGPPAPEKQDSRSREEETSTTPASEADYSTGEPSGEGGGDPESPQAEVPGGDPFSDGFMTAFLGSGNSELMTEFGVAPGGYNDIDLQTKEGRSDFNHLWESKRGNNPLMDDRDVGQGVAQQQAQAWFDGGFQGNPMDDLGMRLDNQSQVGGTHWTMGDVLGLIYGDGDRMLGDAMFKDDDGSLMNGLILSTISENYPTHVTQSTGVLLNQAQQEYNTAVLTGYTGSYADFFREKGYADAIGGF